MKRGTIELLLLLGIVLVSGWILLFIGKGVHESFQTVATNAQSIIDIPTIPKVIINKTSYAIPTETRKATYERTSVAKIIKPSRFIKISGPTAPAWLNISQVAAWSGTTNVALNKHHSNSGEHVSGSTPGTKAFDGTYSARVYPGGFHSSGIAGWIMADFGSLKTVDRIEVYNRAEDCCRSRLTSYKAELLDETQKVLYSYQLNGNDSQSITVVADTCPSGSSNINGTCYTNCLTGETATGTTCVPSCPSGFTGTATGTTCTGTCKTGEKTLNGQCYVPCVSPDTEYTDTQCYEACKIPNRDNDATTCYTPCPATHRLIENKCFPTMAQLAYDRKIVTKDIVPFDEYTMPVYTKPSTPYKAYINRATPVDKVRRTARYIKIEPISKTSGVLHISQLAAWSGTTNVALNKHHSNSGDDGKGLGPKAFDGSYSSRAYPGGYHSSTGNAWIMADFGSPKVIDRVEVYNRGDCCQDKLGGYYFKVALYDEKMNFMWSKELKSASYQSFDTTELTTCPSGSFGAGNPMLCYSKSCPDDEISFFTITDARACRTKCPSGYTERGTNLTTYIPSGMFTAAETAYNVGTGVCEPACNSGYTDDTNGKCYIPCKTGYTNVAGIGVCRSKTCPSGSTLSGSSCYKPCVSPDIEKDATSCIVACPATHRLIGNTCFPRDPYSYLNVVAFGPIRTAALSSKVIAGGLDAINGKESYIWDSTVTETDFMTDQNWIFTEDGRIINSNSRKCIDAGSANGNITVWDCHNEDWQKWNIDIEGRIRSSSTKYPNKCVTLQTITDGAIANGTLFTISDCQTTGLIRQKFIVPARTKLSTGPGVAAAAPMLPNPINITNTEAFQSK